MQFSRGSRSSLFTAQKANRCINITATELLDNRLKDKQPSTCEKNFPYRIFLLQRVTHELRSNYHWSIRESVDDKDQLKIWWKHKNLLILQDRSFRHTYNNRDYAMIVWELDCITSRTWPSKCKCTNSFRKALMVQKILLQKVLPLFYCYLASARQQVVNRFGDIH